MTIERIDPGRRFAQAVAYGDTVYLAGHTASNPEAGVYEQTREVLAAIDAHLAAAGSDKSKLLSASIWLPDIGTFDEMNRAWDEWVDPANLPARATVEARLGIHGLQGRDRGHRRSLRRRGGRPGSSFHGSHRPIGRSSSGDRPRVERDRPDHGGLRRVGRVAEPELGIGLVDRRVDPEDPGEAPGVHREVRALDQAPADVERDVDGADARTVRPTESHPGDGDACRRQVVLVGRHDDDHGPAARDGRMTGGGPKTRGQRNGRRQRGGPGRGRPGGGRRDPRGQTRGLRRTRRPIG